MSNAFAQSDEAEMERVALARLLYARTLQLVDNPSRVPFTGSFRTRLLERVAHWKHQKVSGKTPAGRRLGFRHHVQDKIILFYVRDRVGEKHHTCFVVYSCQGGDYQLTSCGFIDGPYSPDIDDPKYDETVVCDINP